MPVGEHFTLGMREALSVSWCLVLHQEDGVRLHLRCLPHTSGRQWGLRAGAQWGDRQVTHIQGGWVCG